MPNVLVAGGIHPSGVALLRSAKDVTVDYVEEVSTQSYLPFLERADAVLIRTQPMPADAIGRAGRLKIVSRHGVGYDAVDVAELSRRGIPLAIVGDVNSRTVAEHTMMFLLAAAKRLIAHDAASRSGDWERRNSFDGIELDGKTLLIIGFGRIGQIVAAMAVPFGLRVTAYDPFRSEAAIAAAGAVPAPDLDTALAAADFVTVHAPKVDGTAILGATELARLKPSAVVVNTARGGLVDEDALAEALRGGRLGAAALDVFQDEPPAPNHPLLADRRVVLTPHTAGLTAECAMRMSLAASRNILDFFEGRLDPALVVNPDVLHRSEASRVA